MHARRCDPLPPRLRAQDGYTALMRAARYKADGVAKLLIDAKADLEAKDKVRPVGRCICIPAWRLAGWWAGGRVGPGRVHERRMHACMHACAEVH